MKDHPYIYKDFEGTISAGNSGYGTVIIWENGNYILVNKQNSTAIEIIL